MQVIFEPPVTAHDAALYEAMEITPQFVGFGSIGASELRQYDEQGFLAIRGGFSQLEVEAAVRELTTMMTSADPQCESVYFESSIRQYVNTPVATQRERSEAVPNIPVHLRAPLVRKFMGFSQMHPPLAVFMQNPELLRIVGQIIGGPVRCFQEMALIKPPHGQEKPWHQDHAYFNLPLEAKVVGVWIALAEVTPEMGCMHVVPGGHRDGPRPHFKRRDWQLCDDALTDIQRMAIRMEAGDVLLFDSKLPHGTPTNRTDRQRFAVQFHFAPQQSTETSDEERMAIFGGEGKDVRC